MLPTLRPAPQVLDPDRLPRGLVRVARGILDGITALGAASTLEARA
jgi:hypothetical protein